MTTVRCDYCNQRNHDQSLCCEFCGAPIEKEVYLGPNVALGANSTVNFRDNIAIGWDAMKDDTFGVHKNMAIGIEAGHSISDGRIYFGSDV